MTQTESCSCRGGPAQQGRPWHSDVTLLCPLLWEKPRVCLRSSNSHSHASIVPQDFRTFSRGSQVTVLQTLMRCVCHLEGCLAHSRY